MAEWQIWGASNVAHLVEAEPTRRSGVRTMCGRYVGRGLGAPFFALDTHERDIELAVRSYDARMCDECREPTD